MLILETIAEAGKTVEQAAANMAGNYKRFRNYAFFATDIPRYDTIMIGCIVNNEYTLKQLTNLEAITQALAPYVGNPREGATASIYKQDFCGDKDLLTEMMVQVYEEDGSITPAFRAIYKLARKLQRSGDGIIDEKLYKIVNRRELLSYVAGELPYACEELGIPYSDDLITTVVDDLIMNEEADYDTIDPDQITNSLKEMEPV